MYDTSNAKELVSKHEEMEAWGVNIYRTYFETKNGRYFSARESRNLRKSFNLPENTEMQTMYISYDDLKIETKLSAKEIIGKSNVELYKKLFGEVEEA